VEILPTKTIITRKPPLTYRNGHVNTCSHYRPPLSACLPSSNNQIPFTVYGLLFSVRSCSPFLCSFWITLTSSEAWRSTDSCVEGVA
jgi:hypothetical protein